MIYVNVDLYKYATRDNGSIVQFGVFQKRARLMATEGDSLTVDVDVLKADDISVNDKDNGD